MFDDGSRLLTSEVPKLTSEVELRFYNAPVPTSQQIHDDLRPHLRGSVAVDDVTRQLYSTDASPFQIVPAAVVVPVEDTDVARVVKYAFDNSIPIAARGAGTGQAGECLTPGIVLDLSIHFRSIQAIGPDWVRVQPGVTLAELTTELVKQGRRLPLPNTINTTATLGGLIAGNAGGGLRDRLDGAKVVWDSGDVSELQLTPADAEPPDAIVRSRRESLAALMDSQRDALRSIWHGDRHRPQSVPETGFLQNSQVNLVRLFAGTEGALGIILEATLFTEGISHAESRVVAGFATMEAAIAAWPLLQEAHPVLTCDLLDQRLVSFARSRPCELILPPGCAAVMILTHVGASDTDAITAARTAEAIITASQGVILHAATTDSLVCNRIQRFFETATFGFYAMPGPRRPVPLIDDIVLDTSLIAAFLQQMQGLLRQYELTAAFHIALPGAIHCRPLIDLTDRAEQAKAWALADAVHTLALSLGGQIGSRHGIGLARTPWMEKQAGPLSPLVREIKRIFDPRNILNPGKIVGPDPSRPAWPFAGRSQGSGVRGQENAKPDNPIPLVTVSSLEVEAGKCNACGDCRVRSAPSRMCPLFRVTGDEAATPRAKANLIRRVLAADDPERLAADDIKAVADLCIHCGQCKDECRAGVDIPHLMVDAKAAHYAAHGFDRHEWLIARSERLAGLAGTFALSANALLGMKPTRWLFEKLFGLSRHRMLHRFTYRTFLRRRFVRRLFRRLPSNPKKLAYFVDTFANTNDPLLAEATVAVLEHHGYAVHVPRRQRGSGMPALSVGDADTARARAAYNVPPLAELVRDGYRVICSEPSAALALTQEYPRLLNGDDDAKLVAANTLELTAFLGELQSRGELKPATKELAYALGHHVPCHLKSLGRPPMTKSLLETVPGLSVCTVDVGCSGAAGLWGVTKSNYEMSLKIGEPVFAALAAGEVTHATSECSACRLQIQQGTGKRALHPVQWLALGYGFVPRLHQRLTRPLHPRLTG